MMRHPFVIDRGVFAVTRNRFATQSVVLAAVVMLAGAALAPRGVATVSVAHAEECGYSGCHNGAPIPGTEGSAEATPCLPSAPKPARAVRAGRRAVFTGALTPAASTATTIGVAFERRRGKRFRPWATKVVAVASGVAGFSASAKLPTRGTWRVRAFHAEADGSRSTSAWRSFKVR